MKDDFKLIKNQYIYHLARKDVWYRAKGGWRSSPGTRAISRETSADLQNYMNNPTKNDYNSNNFKNNGNNDNINNESNNNNNNNSIIERVSYDRISPHQETFIYSSKRDTVVNKLQKLISHGSNNTG